MIVNLSWVSHVVDMSMANGCIPVELHMNLATHEAFTHTLRMSGEKPPKVRFRGEQRFEDPWKFRGLPLVVNPAIPEMGVIVRGQGTLGDPNWLENMMEAKRKQVEEQQNAAPAIPLVNGDVRSSAVVGHPTDSVSDTLMSALTRCDDVETAIVILHRKGEVEVSSNARRFEVQGLLGAALARVAQEG